MEMDKSLRERKRKRREIYCVENVSLITITNQVQQDLSLCQPAEVWHKIQQREWKRNQVFSQDPFASRELYLGPSRMEVRCYTC